MSKIFSLEKMTASQSIDSLKQGVERIIDGWINNSENSLEDLQGFFVQVSYPTQESVKDHLEVSVYSVKDSEGTRIGTLKYLSDLYKSSQKERELTIRELRKTGGSVSLNYLNYPYKIQLIEQEITKKPWYSFFSILKKK